VKHNGLHTKNNEESYYAWSFMVPADAEIRSNIGYWESRMTSLNTMTFWIEPGDGGTVIKFGTGNLGQTTRWTAKLELNEWHRIAIHNIWSQDENTGKVDVWYDGAQVVTGATATKRDANELFFQMGLHRSDPADPVQVIYIDAAREATTQEEILMPLPDLPGMGGAGGSAGAAGAAGTAPGGAAGSDMGGSTSTGGGGAPSAGGVPVVAGMGGAAQAGTSSTTPPIMRAPTTSDDGSCSLTVTHGSSSGSAWLVAAAAAALLVGRRRR
jgi:MYXO-CTERM domain-containing protein